MTAKPKVPPPVKAWAITFDNGKWFKRAAMSRLPYIMESKKSACALRRTHGGKVIPVLTAAFSGIDLRDFSGYHKVLIVNGSIVAIGPEIPPVDSITPAPPAPRKGKVAK